MGRRDPGGSGGTGSTMENSLPPLSALAHKRGCWLPEYKLVAPGNRPTVEKGSLSTRPVVGH